MDADRFDQLLRSLSETPSRRVALRLLVGSALGGLLGGAAVQETDAHDLLTKCKTIKNGLRKQRCVKQGKKHNVQHAKESVGILLPPPPPPVCSNPPSCQSDGECCATHFCSCGEPHVCIQAGSLGTGACCKRDEECLQDCVVGSPGSQGVCCNPAAPETCVCRNCSACVPYAGTCTQSSDCCGGVPCTGNNEGENFTCRYP